MHGTVWTIRYYISGQGLCGVCYESFGGISKEI